MAREIIAFLKESKGKGFCSECLASKFNLGFREAGAALVEAGEHIALTQSRGPCTICGRRALVTGVELADPLTAEERVREFIHGHPGQFLCNTCLAHRLQLAFDTVQKAVWQLRPEIRSDAAECSECGKRRLVVGSPVRQVIRRMGWWNRGIKGAPSAVPPAASS